MSGSDLVLRVKRVNELAKLPEYAHEGDAGMDLFAVEERVIEPGERALVGTGIVIELPPNTEAQVRPRSGMALNHGITVLNTPGTIDEGYRGEVKVILINLGKTSFKVERHMKIAQMVIKSVLRASVIEADELSDSERAEGGFGSTGKM
ncbi:MAG: dUTP diphosphatase [Firmicutes bacterium]|nr:dUTP diphosphatase [Bacillota bacterium]